MEASYPDKQAALVAETNYFLHLYATFHPVYTLPGWNLTLIDMFT